MAKQGTTADAAAGASRAVASGVAAGVAPGITPSVTPSVSPSSSWDLDDAYRGPGHLIRRLQQIAVGIFMDEFKSHDITPVQYIALVAIRDRPGLEQQAIADLIAIDRSSVGRVISFLEQRGLIARVTPDSNRRSKQAFVTPAGQRFLAATSGLIARAEERILHVMDDREQRAFMSGLRKLVDINNALSRAPLRMPGMARHPFRPDDGGEQAGRRRTSST